MFSRFEHPALHPRLPQKDSNHFTITKTVTQSPAYPTPQEYPAPQSQVQVSPHNLEGYNPIAQLPQHNEGKAQSQAKDRVYNLVVSNNNHKTISFSHTKNL